MTRKHYKLIAAALASTQPHSSYPEARIAANQWQRDVEAIASALASDNAAFDRARFIKAVGL